MNPATAQDRRRDGAAIRRFLHGTDLSRADLPPGLVECVKLLARVRRVVRVKAKERAAARADT